jgi:hypothetical protein
MPDLWEKVKKTVTEIYTTASERAVDGVHLGVKKLDEAGIRRELSKEFAALGGRTYQLLQKDEAHTLPSDAVVLLHMDRLRELELRLEEKEEEISEIRRGRPAVPSPQEEPSTVTSEPSRGDPGPDGDS